MNPCETRSKKFPALFIACGKIYLSQIRFSAVSIFRHAKLRAAGYFRIFSGHCHCHWIYRRRGTGRI